MKRTAIEAFNETIKISFQYSSVGVPAGFERAGQDLYPYAYSTSRGGGIQSVLGGVYTAFKS